MRDLNEATLEALAGARSFERGRGYRDAVSAVEFGEDRVSAVVHGTERYAAKLALAGPEGLAGTCTCPYGREGNFCKHLVALGLVVLAEGDGLAVRRTAARDRARQLDAWLSGLPHEELLTLVRDQMAGDERLRRSLELRAASAGGDLAGVRSRVRELLDIGPFAQYGHVEYADARAYADQAGQVAAVIRELTGSGRAADAIELAQDAIRLLAEVVESVDDSDGGLGTLGTDLADAHHEACRAAPPVPEELARWLVDHALDDAADLTDLDPLDYEDLLGDRGMDALRRYAVEAWQANRSGWSEKDLLQRLARAGRDLDTVIAVHAADLAPSGHTHLLIARELEAAGRFDEALSWAERGIRDTDDLAVVDTALVDYLADRHAREDRLPAAAVLRRDHFAARRTLLAYRQLRAASRAVDRWPTERTEALDLLRADAEQRAVRGAPVLVDALLDDGDGDAAWEAAAEFGAYDHQWLALADQSRAVRPRDALAAYRRLAAPLARQVGNDVYERLVGLLLSMRDCHRHLDSPEEFAAYVTELRTDQKRKRNLMRLMDEHGL
ncbi:hypothetical protein [Streptomyces sp. NPDC048057]|uniref:SWIM zinc finger family protein n=1 Tax=Streptomyces sp. NPDC048057 TaxID=3155628 RepID=UPI003401887A